jgi:hypothetical protein
MKSLALLLLLIGIVAITIGYTKHYKKCPPPKIEYRYVQRSLLDEQYNEDNVNKMWTDMQPNVVHDQVDNNKLAEYSSNVT